MRVTRPKLALGLIACTALSLVAPIGNAWAQDTPRESREARRARKNAETAPERPRAIVGAGSGGASAAAGSGGGGGASAATRVRDGFVGTFKQTDGAAMSARGGVSASQLYTITADLDWAPESADKRSAPTFGAVSSKFYRPTDGEITVEVTSVGTGIAGSCEYNGRQSFRIADLPARALQYLSLEVAEDGRYKATLVVPDYTLLFEVEIVCSRGARSTSPVNEAAVTLGIQQGTLDASRNADGKLATPIINGPRSIDGEWSFRGVPR